MFRGLGPPVVGSAFYNAVLFSTYERCLHEFNVRHKNKHSPLPLQYYLLSGAFGGFAQSFVLCPIDVVKSKMQVMGLGHGSAAHLQQDSKVGSPSSFQVARDIVKQNGVRGLFLGLVPTLCRDVIGYGFFFWSYEGLKTITGGPVDAHIPEQKVHAHHSATSNILSVIVSGGLAGVIYHTTTHPSMYAH